MGAIRLDFSTHRRLQAANHSHWTEPVRHPDRRMRVHDLVYLVKGSWEIWEEKTAYMLGPDDVVFLTAGRHHFGKIGCRKGTHTLWIHAFPEPADAYLEGAVPENSDTALFLAPFVSAGKDPKIRALFEAIIRGYWSSSPTRRALSRVQFSELLLGLSTLSREEERHSASAMDHLTDFVERHPGRFFTIDELARRIGYHRRTLTDHFRKRTGETVHGFQIRLKIRMAAAIFDHIPDTPVKELAARFGFHDEFHFSKTFKKIIGQSPLDYRRRTS